MKEALHRILDREPVNASNETVALILDYAGNIKEDHEMGLQFSWRLIRERQMAVSMKAKTKTPGDQPKVTVVA